VVKREFICAYNSSNSFNLYSKSKELEELYAQINSRLTTWSNHIKYIQINDTQRWSLLKEYDPNIYISTIKISNEEECVFDINDKDKSLRNFEKLKRDLTSLLVSLRERDPAKTIGDELFIAALRSQKASVYAKRIEIIMKEKDTTKIEAKFQDTFKDIPNFKAAIFNNILQTNFPEGEIVDKFNASTYKSHTVLAKFATINTAKEIYNFYDSYKYMFEDFYIDSSEHKTIKTSSYISNQEIEGIKKLIQELEKIFTALNSNNITNVTFFQTKEWDSKKEEFNKKLNDIINKIQTLGDKKKKAKLMSLKDKVQINNENLTNIEQLKVPSYQIYTSKETKKLDEESKKNIIKFITQLPDFKKIVDFSTLNNVLQNAIIDRFELNFLPPKELKKYLRKFFNFENATSESDLPDEKHPLYHYYKEDINIKRLEIETALSDAEEIKSTVAKITADVTTIKTDVEQIKPQINNNIIGPGSESLSSKINALPPMTAITNVVTTTSTNALNTVTGLINGLNSTISNLSTNIISISRDDEILQFNIDLLSFPENKRDAFTYIHETFKELNTGNINNTNNLLIKIVEEQDATISNAYKNQIKDNYDKIITALQLITNDDTSNKEAINQAIETAIDSTTKVLSDDDCKDLKNTILPGVNILLNDIDRNDILNFSTLDKTKTRLQRKFLTLSDKWKSNNNTRVNAEKLATKYTENEILKKIQASRATTMNANYKKIIELLKAKQQLFKADTKNEIITNYNYLNSNLTLIKNDANASNNVKALISNTIAELYRLFQLEKYDVKYDANGNITALEDKVGTVIIQPARPSVT